MTRAHSVASRAFFAGVVAFALMASAATPGLAAPLPDQPSAVGLPAPRAPLATWSEAPSVSVLVEADDDIPGVVRTSPYSDILTWSGGAFPQDAVDVIRVDIPAGHVFTAKITFPVGSWVFAELLAPGSSSVYTDAPYAWSTPYSATEDRLSAYSASGGTYYLALYVPWLGDPRPEYWPTTSVAYTVDFQSNPPGANGDVPSAEDADALVTADRSLDWRTNPNHVFSRTLAEGDELYVTLTSPPGADFELMAYGPGATGVWGQTPAWAYDLGSGVDELRLLVPPGGAGTYYIEAFTQVDSGVFTATFDLDSPSVPRVAGEDRYLTSAAISRSTFTTASAAVLATGRNHADALAASPLAGVLGAPLLLVPPYDAETGLDAPRLLPVLVELERLGVTDVYIAGGTAAVTADTADAVADLGITVQRLEGATRYATAAAIASEVRSIQPTDAAFLVRGDGFADALAVSPYAASQGIPVLLTPRTTLNSGARAFIEDNDVLDVTIAGGELAVSAGVAGAVDALNGGATSVTRKAGGTRYDTAAAVARYAIDDRGWGSWDFIGVATGRSFPDALSGGAVCGRRAGALVLTPRDELSPAVKSIIAEKAPQRVMVFGGGAAVSEATRATIQGLMP